MKPKAKTTYTYESYAKDILLKKAKTMNGDIQSEERQPEKS